MTTVQTNYSSLLDQNMKQLAILPVHSASNLSHTSILAFDNASKNVQLDANVGTTRTGWVVSIKATQDCWIKFGTTAPTAASDTANNILIKAGVVYGPIYMGSFTYVAAIRDAASAVNGTLNIIYHTYTV